MAPVCAKYTGPARGCSSSGVSARAVPTMLAGGQRSARREQRGEQA
jgi:hypothetical protein